MDIPTEAVVSVIVAMAGGMVAMHLRAEARGRACDRKYDALLRYVLAARDATIERNTTVMNLVLQAFGKAAVEEILEPQPHPHVPQLGDEVQTDRVVPRKHRSGAALHGVRAGLVLVALLLTGCWQTREESTRAEVEHRQGVEAGQSTDLTITRQTQEKTSGTAGVDPAQLAALVSTAVRAAVPGADAVASAVRGVLPAPADLGPLTAQVQALAGKPDPAPGHGGDIAGGALGLLGLVAAALKAREAAAHRADADEAWGKVEEHALARQPPAAGGAS